MPKAKVQDSEMLPEYDFSKGVRGKYAAEMRKGYIVRIRKADNTVVEQHYMPQKGAVMLEPDVRAYFPDAQSVNDALRALIKIVPKSRRGSSKPKRTDL